jgi:hypothetical protein
MTIDVAVAPSRQCCPCEAGTKACVKQNHLLRVLRLRQATVSGIDKGTSHGRPQLERYIGQGWDDAVERRE